MNLLRGCCRRNFAPYNFLFLNFCPSKCSAEVKGFLSSLAFSNDEGLAPANKS
jgi:hypothetical protein